MYHRRFISIITFFTVILILLQGCTWRPQKNSSKLYVYQVLPCNSPPVIDADWTKEFWRNCDSISLKNFMGDYPAHFPETRVKMRYDNNNVYLIFRVADQYVRAVAKKINGKVWQDSCAEFFFTPGKDSKKGYFNMESNCKGVFLLEYHDTESKKEGFVDTLDCATIEIAHSLKDNAEEEIRNQVVWIVEYRLPLSFLSKYMEVENPGKGKMWRANFYKCADSTSQPHWLTWAPVHYPKPKFHLPEFFGWLEFK